MIKNPFHWMVILLPLLTVVLLTNSKIGSPNDASRMATIQALVENHTLALTDMDLSGMVDIMRRNGNFYSDKPPMLQILGVLVYSPLHQTLGLNFEKNIRIIYYLLTLIFAGIPFVIICYLLYRIFLMIELNQSGIWLLFLLSWLGTIMLPYSITFNNHLITASLLLLTIFLYLRQRIQSKSIKGLYFWQGFLLSSAITLEFPTGGLAFLCFIGIIYFQTRSLSNIGKYLLGSVIPLTVHFYFNYHQTGDLIPAYLHKEFYNYPGTVWGGELGKKRLFGKTLLGQYFHMLMGYRGLFLFSLALLPGFFESIRLSIRSKQPYQPLAITTLIILWGTISSYAIQISDFGGGSYGLRWIIAVIPLLVFFTALWLKHHFTQIYRFIFMVLLIPSILISLIGIYNPWPENVLSPSPVLENIAYLSFSPRTGKTGIAEYIIEHTSLEKGFSYYELARKSIEYDKLDYAIRYFEKSLSYDPHHTLTYYHLGIAYDRNNQSEKAVPIYETLIQLDPGNIGALNNFGISLIRIGDFQRAEKIYRKSISKDSNRFSSHLGLSESLIGQKQYSDALEEIKKCLELEPNSKEAQIIYQKLKLMLKSGE